MSIFYSKPKNSQRRILIDPKNIDGIHKILLLLKISEGNEIDPALVEKF